MTHNKRSFQLLYNNTGAHFSKGLENHAQIHTSWSQNNMAETLVAVICNQLSNIPDIFRHCDLLDLNRVRDKKLQVNNNSFTDCHTEGLITKAN